MNLNISMGAMQAVLRRISLSRDYNPITIHREGEFTIVRLPESPCGREQAGMRIPIRYSANISIDKDDLDDRGFIIDQIDIAKYFDRITESGLSCEQLAMKAATDLADLVRGPKRKRILWVSVNLSPEPFGASIWYHHDEEAE